jgi:hypothetical protein
MSQQHCKRARIHRTKARLFSSREVQIINADTAAIMAAHWRHNSLEVLIVKANAILGEQLG